MKISRKYSFRDSSSSEESHWWRKGVIYQIYPRSFFDSNGDGIGDINGIIEKIDYLADLGVDAVWLSPINRSPMDDFGYDIKDYRRIAPVFGCEADFDELIRRLHEKNIRIIFDLVMNHTSNLHYWFIESRLSKKSPKRDWYIWHPGRNGKAPNNWRGAFGGSAWEFDEGSGEYYLHSFLKEQPDLNWRNPQMVKAVFDDVEYWLKRGIDGFRLDVVNWFIKDDQLRSNPYTIGYSPRPYDMQRHLYDRNRPETHDVLKQFRALLDRYSGRMSVGEVFSAPPGDQKLSASYVGNGSDQLDMAFDFSLMYVKWDAKIFFRKITGWFDALPDGGWPCHVFNNHDQSRAASRFAKRGETDPRMKILSVLLLTLPGTPFVYYGEEIGMANGKIRRSEMRDPLGKRYWPFFKGRDPERTPMQWNGGTHAGFSSGIPWLPVNADYRSRCVEEQIDNPRSILALYRRLITLRKTYSALSGGEIEFTADGTGGIISYIRSEGQQKITVVVNFKNKPVRGFLIPDGIILEQSPHWDNAGDAIPPYGYCITLLK